MIPSPIRNHHNRMNSFALRVEWSGFWDGLSLTSRADQICRFGVGDGTGEGVRVGSGVAVAAGVEVLTGAVCNPQAVSRNKITMLM